MNNEQNLDIEARNRLLLAEIEQYHSVVKDFSHQSSSIKKISITIFISFISLIYGSNQLLQTKFPMEVFLIIGIMIPLLCYFFEIYVDNVRQKMRVKMRGKIVEYQKLNGFSDADKYPEQIIVYKVLFLKIMFRDNEYSFIKTPSSEVLFVNAFHSMYFMYLIELVTVIIMAVRYYG